MSKTSLAVCLSTIAFAATAAAAPFTLKSTDFKAGGAIPDKFTFNSFGCTGDNVSPELEWSNPPAGTKSFALMVHDPDAPTGGAGFWHWVVYNIPADAKTLPQGAGKADNSAIPKGATQGNTDFGSPGYGGPCPPQRQPSLQLHAVRAEDRQARAAAGRDRLVRRVQRERQHAGQGDAHRHVRGEEEVTTPR